MTSKEKDIEPKNLEKYFNTGTLYSKQTDLQMILVESAMQYCKALVKMKLDGWW
jgi:hypothetical protein